MSHSYFLPHILKRAKNIFRGALRAPLTSEDEVPVKLFQKIDKSQETFVNLCIHSDNLVLY